MRAVCAKCSRLMCRAVVLFLVAECAQTTPMIAPLPGDPNFSIDGSVAFFKSGESNPTQPNPPATSSGAPTPSPGTRPLPDHVENPTNPRHPQPPPTHTTASPPSRGHQGKPHHQTPQATTTTPNPQPTPPPSPRPAPPAAAPADPYARHNPAAMPQHLRHLDQEVLRLHTSGTTQRIRAANLVQAATLGNGVWDLLFNAFLHAA